MLNMPSVISLNCFLTAVLFVVVSSGLSSAKAEASGDLEPVNGGALCSDVRQILEKKDIGVSRQVPEREIKGDHLQICASNRSCCTREMEETYKMAAKMDFRLRLQGSGSYLKMLITTNANQFLERFQDMVKLAENNTHTLFSQTYQKMESVARLPTEQLFHYLLAYLKGEDINLEARVDSFFKSLFPVVYRHIINPDMKDVSNDYKKCLKEKTPEIKPFGDKAMLISLQIVRSFDVARSLLQALNLGVEVINTTEHMDFGPGCYNALVRLTYCAHCQRLILAKPCGGFCLNVVHGCLAQVTELDRPWNKYVSALNRVTTGMADSSNIEKVMNLLDTKISEAIMHAMEDGSEVTKKVKSLCGHLQRSTRSSSEVTDSQQETNGSIVTSRTVVSTWQSELQDFVKTLKENKWFYTKLADSLCNNETFSVQGEVNCWNGKEIGEYKKTISGIGATAQKLNPEVLPSKTEELVITTLIDKLLHMTKLLDSKVDSVPDPNSLFTLEYGSGSGLYYNTIIDDEDYNFYNYYGSGSGDIWNVFDYSSGSGDELLTTAVTTIEEYTEGTEKETDIHFPDEGRSTTEATKTKTNDRSSGNLVTDTTTVISIFVFMVTLQFLRPH